MIKRLAGACGLVFLTATAGVFASSVTRAQTASPPASDITVANSPNAVTGQTITIGTIIYQEARRDPVTRRFVASLRSYAQFMSDNAYEMEEKPVYMFAIDDGGSPKDSTGDIYFVTVADLEGENLSDRVAHCEVAYGASVFGFVARATAAGLTNKVKMRMMTRDHAGMVQRLCNGLRRPLSSLTSGGDSSSDVTVLDYLSRTQEGLGFGLISDQMMGQDLETSVFRNYWTGALALRYRRPPAPNSILTPEIYNQIDKLQRGEWIEGDLPRPSGAFNPGSYPAQAEKEFGTRLARLDADWADYLSTAAITVRNERRPLFVNGRLARVFPRFKLSEIGTSEFWRSANDLGVAFQQAHCLAQQFLIDKEYIAPEDAQFIKRCGLDDIR